MYKVQNWSWRESVRELFSEEVISLQGFEGAVGTFQVPWLGRTVHAEA